MARVLLRLVLCLDAYDSHLALLGGQEGERTVSFVDHEHLLGRLGEELGLL